MVHELQQFKKIRVVFYCSVREALIKWSQLLSPEIQTAAVLDSFLLYGLSTDSSQWKLGVFCQLTLRPFQKVFGLCSEANIPLSLFT